MLDWMEFEPYFTEVALIMGNEYMHWNDIMTFPVSEHGANDLNDLIIVLTQMRDYIEDRCNAPKVGELDHVQSVRGIDTGVDTAPGFSPAKRRAYKRQPWRKSKRLHRDSV